ncbi:helix-turn-helix domain-containing protein [Planifilum fimeticola]
MDKRDVEFWRELKVRPDYRGLEIQLIKKGLTKTQLREQVGFSTGTLAKFKKGDYVALELLLKIAVFLNCSLGDLVDVHPADRIKDKP